MQHPIGIIRCIDSLVAQFNEEKVPEVVAVDLAPYSLLDHTRYLYYLGKGERSTEASSFGGELTAWSGAVKLLTDEVL